ncbi:MAG: acyl-CoA thioesterase [Treponema sp.]|nr:acyl-CoA thioesterase [Treponema sp.]
MKKHVHYVNYYETDRMGVTHHSNYIRWMEEARIDYLKQIGWDYAKLEEKGIISPVLSVSCKYKHSTTFDDTVEVATSIEKYTGIKLILKYKINNSKGEIVSEGTSEHCFIDKDGKIIQIKKEYPDFHEVLSSLVEK